jgi:RHS repeat-associated protein
LDNETGLYYLRARYYDPETGRFLSEDTNWNPNNMICGDDPGDNDTPNIAAIIQSSNL